MHTLKRVTRAPLFAVKLFQRGGWLFLLTLILAPALVLAQSSTCPQFVQTALQSTDQFCQGTGRNQACYGHRLLDAQPQPGFDVIGFASEGDVIDLSHVQSLRLSALDLEAGVWGISLLRLQASLANALSANDITLLLFGDVAMETAEEVSVRIPVTVTASQNINMRLGAADTAPVTLALSPGQTVMARGRLADNSWLYVETPEGVTGWVYAPLVTSEGDLETLTVLERAAPRYGPMQAFYLQTGAAAPGCAEAPDNGLLVQTPEGVAEVRLWINDVRIRLIGTSTSFVQADAGSAMTINMLEGAGTIEAGGITYPVVAGTQISIPLDDNLTAAGAPSMPASSELVNVPLDSMPNAGRPIEQHAPFTQEQITDFQERITSGGSTCGSDPYPACPSNDTPTNNTAGQDTTGGTVDSASTNTEGSADGSGGNAHNQGGGPPEDKGGNPHLGDDPPGNSDGVPGGGNDNQNNGGGGGGGNSGGHGGGNDKKDDD